MVDVEAPGSDAVKLPKVPSTDFDEFDQGD